MIRKKVKILNELGIHARPAGMLTRTASRFACDIKLIKDGLEVNAKSIMGVMTLAAACGTSLEIIAEGRDEAEAVRAEADPVVAGEERQLGVIGIREHAFVAGWTPIPASPFAAVPHPVLEAALGVGLHHRPEDSVGLSPPPQLIERLDVVIGLAGGRAAVFEDAE